MDGWLESIAAKAALMSDSRLLVLRKLAHEAKAGPLGSIERSEMTAAYDAYVAEAERRGL